MVRVAFDQIWHYGAGDARVIQHLLKTIKAADECITDRVNEEILRRYAQAIRDGERGKLLRQDLERL
jgi:uncharacterized membrane protein